MPRGLRFLTQRWFQVLGGGVVLFLGAEQGLKLTGNPNLIPTVLIVGASVIPLAFVSYFFSAERVLDRGAHGEISLPLVAISVFLGGAIGVTAAGVVEYSTLTRLSISTIFGVAVIEESAKLIVPLFIFAYSRFRSRADGLFFGVATGMGFAALETMGYGMVALIRSRGDIGGLEEILLVRGLLSPLGHAAWTGMVCAVLWGRRESTGRAFGPAVIPAFAMAVLLHAAWNLASTPNNIAITYAGYAIVGGVSLGLILHQLSVARRRQSPGQPLATAQLPLPVK
jgi:RsiW-degrading membrane proteinase PrsW (M82 family)